MPRKRQASKAPQAQPGVEPTKETSPRGVDVWRLVDREQIAQLLGVHPDTVTDFARSGMPVKKRGGAGVPGVYDAVDCLEWWRSRQGKNALETAKTRQAESSALLNEQKLARERGELVARDQVVLEGQSYTKAWTAKVRAIPRLLIKEGAIDRALESRVAAVCANILRDIAGWKTAEDAERGAKEADAA